MNQQNLHKFEKHITLIIEMKTKTTIHKVM